MWFSCITFFTLSEYFNLKMILMNLFAARWRVCSKQRCSPRGRPCPEDTFWSPSPRRSSPWPWTRSLKSSKSALSSAWEQHYFLNRWIFVGKRLKPRGKFAKTHFCFPQLENAWKKFWRLFLEGEHLCLCPWFLALDSSIPVLGLERVCPRKGCPWPWPRNFFVSLALASSLVSSTPSLVVEA